MKLEIIGDHSQNTVIKLDGEKVEYATDVMFSLSLGYSSVDIRLLPEMVDIQEDGVNVYLTVGERVFRVMEVTPPEEVE